MKIKGIILLIGVLSVSNTYAQRNGESQEKKYPLAKVKDWGKKSMSFADNFWDNKKDQIVMQIGEAEYEKMLRNSDWRKIPGQMSIWNGKKKTEPAVLYPKLDKLNVFQIASFNHVYQGKDFGKFVILRCPFEENKNWDSTATWDTVYFIVEEAGMERNISKN